MTPFDFLILSILILSLVLGFLAVFFNAFGTWIIFIGAFIYAYFTHFEVITVRTLIVLGGLALAGELMENLFSYFGIKKMGGGTRSVLGAFIGGITGSIAGAAFFGFGVVVGGLSGVFLGAFLMDLTRSGSLVKSLKVGLGGILGFAGAVLMKIVAALIMIQMIVALLWKA